MRHIYLLGSMLTVGCGGRASQVEQTLAEPAVIEGRVWRAEGQWTQHPFSPIEPGRAITLAIDGDGPPYRFVDADVRVVPAELGESEVMLSIAGPRDPSRGSNVVWLTHPKAPRGTAVHSYPIRRTTAQRYCPGENPELPAFDQDRMQSR